MQFAYASVPATAAPNEDVPNEDVLVAGTDFAAVLDGATAVPGLDTGCVHDVAWFARRLGAALGWRLGAPGSGTVALSTLLRAAMEETMSAHAGTCDLSNPDSPSATVSILRRNGERLDYLVLADSPIVLDLRPGGVRVVMDDRLDHLPDFSIAAVSKLRNSAEGFWVASTVPAAAAHAVTGSVPVSAVRRAAVFSDGAARLVERFGELSWAGLLDLLEEIGPEALIARTRESERTAPAPRRGKRYDDATAVFVSGLS